MINFLQASENLPFAVSLGVLLALALLEAIGLVIGFAFSNLLDSVFDVDVDVDVDLDVDGGDGLDVDGGGVLGWIGFGLVPALVVLLFLFGVFGIFGFAIQGLAINVAGNLLNPWLAAGLALAMALPTVRSLSRLAAKHVFKETTLAVSEESFIGKPAIVTLGAATRGRPTEARLTDEHGQSHYVLVEPANDAEVFGTGSEVLIVDRIGTVFQVIGNSAEALMAMSDRPTAPSREEINEQHTV